MTEIIYYQVRYEVRRVTYREVADGLDFVKAETISCPVDPILVDTADHRAGSRFLKTIDKIADTLWDQLFA